MPSVLKKQLLASFTFEECQVKSAKGNVGVVQKYPRQTTPLSTHAESGLRETFEACQPRQIIKWHSFYISVCRGLSTEECQFYVYLALAFFQLAAIANRACFSTALSFNC